MDGRSIRVPLPTGTREFSLLHSVQTDAEDHPASYPTDTGGSFSGVKRVTNHSSSSSG
jgi:hypothetical protein